MRRLLLSLAVLAGLVLPATAVGATPKRVPFQRGVTVAGWGPTAYPPAAVAKTLRRLKARQHIDTITLIVVWSQTNSKSTVIAPGSETVPDADLVAAIHAARKLHIRVILRPYVDPADGVWRGQIEPTSVAAWFRSYDDFILHYASLAQKQHVSGFVVGSELSSLAKQDSDWRALIARVRARYRGFLTYQANWGGEESSITWWDALDAISISAYYPLAAAPGTDVNALVAAWTDVIDKFHTEFRWFARIDALRQRWQRPVMFGEIGYRTVPEAAVRPWDTTLTGSDSKIQPAAYEAAFRVWYRVPWFRGMHWWYVVANKGAVADDGGADHQPSTASLRVLARWYAQKP